MFLGFMKILFLTFLNVATDKYAKLQKKSKNNKNSIKTNQKYKLANTLPEFIKT